MSGRFSGPDVTGTNGPDVTGTHAPATCGPGRDWYRSSGRDRSNLTLSAGRAIGRAQGVGPLPGPRNSGGPVSQVPRRVTRRLVTVLAACVRLVTHARPFLGLFPKLISIRVVNF